MKIGPAAQAHTSRTRPSPVLIPDAYFHRPVHLTSCSRGLFGDGFVDFLVPILRVAPLPYMLGSLPVDLRIIGVARMLSDLLASAGTPKHVADAAGEPAAEAQVSRSDNCFVSSAPPF